VSALALPALASCSHRDSQNLDARKPSAGAKATANTTATGPARRDAERLAALRVFERDLRARADGHAPPNPETALGPDPWAIRPLSRSSSRAIASHARARYVGILRGRSAIVLLDESLAELARAPAPRGTTGLATLDSGLVAASGELTGEVALFSVDTDAFVPRGHVTLPADGVRDLAVGPDGALSALDARGARVFWLDAASVARAAHGAWLEASAIPSFETCRGGVALTRTASAILTTCVLDHRVDVVPLDTTRHVPDPARRIALANDGPFFGVAAREAHGALTVVAGAVEDHPLDRREGSFGFIDSFVQVFRVTLASGEATRVASIDVTVRGIVTPKALSLDDGAFRVAGYGTPDLVTLSLDGTRELRRVTMPPGARAFEGSDESTVAANPLLDAWIVVDREGTRVVPVVDPSTRSFESRLGEAIVFTTLMAPWN
jgi:hypothetical protein